jgi:ketosteroid isomerase-like protein
VTEPTNELLGVFASFYRVLCEERNVEAASALWAKDEEIALFGSEESDTAVGPDAVRAHLVAIATARSDISFTWHEQQAHVEGDAGWVNASGTLTVDGRQSAYRATGIFVRRGGRWLWHTHSGSEPRS